MQTFLVIALVDGTQITRLMLGWSEADAALRARYYWRNNTLGWIEVHAPLDVTVPDDFEP